MKHCLKILSSFLLGFLTTPLLANQIDWLDKEPTLLFPNESIHCYNTKNIDIKCIKQYLFTSFAIDTNTVKLLYFRESGISKHFEFEQILGGLPVFGSSLKVNTLNDGRIISVSKKLVPNGLFDGYSEIAAPTIIPQLNDYENVRTVWYPKGSDWIIGYEGFVEDKISHKKYHKVFDKGQNLIHNREISLHNGKDTIIKAYIFNPDPLTTLKVDYGGYYRDRHDSTYPELDASRSLVDISAKYVLSSKQTDSFYLESDYLVFEELGNPYTGFAWADKPEMFYNRSQTGFEDVNVFYHIHKIQEHIKNLKVKGLDILKIKVDPHGLPDDNSMFIPSSDSLNNKLYYGVGGVDDAEDADVIIHEYTHGLIQMASPFSTSGSERLSLEEGTCDYITCSYSSSISKFRSEWCYNWDGHNEFWRGRNCRTNYTYPTPCSSGGTYACGELWAGTLMDISDEIGRDTMDYLVLNALFQYQNQMKLPASAKIIIRLDSLLFNGKHYLSLSTHFVNRKILSEKEYPVGIETQSIKEVNLVLNQRLLAQNKIIQVETDKVLKGNVVLQSINGKVIYQNTINSSSFTYDASNLPKGVYILQIVSNEGYIKPIKLIIK